LALTTSGKIPDMNIGETRETMRDGDQPDLTSQNPVYPNTRYQITPIHPRTGYEYFVPTKTTIMLILLREGLRE